MSLMFSILLGAVTGALAALAGVHGALVDAAAQPCAMLLFLIGSERLFTEMFPARTTRLVVAGVLLAIAVVSGLLQWNYVVLTLLGIYALFAAYDLMKNWRRKKMPVFDPELMRPAMTPANPVQFSHKPNVYLLLLESMHSREALAKIYGVEEIQAEDYLRGKGFTIYPNTFSNKHSTPLSLKTLLTGSLDFKADPVILQNFIYNGYKCNFYDSMYYLSQPYIKFLDQGNAAMPLWILRLYTYIGPFFAQSRWFRYFAGNIDPFDTDNLKKPFATMREAFQRALANADKTPCFSILHFGASHFGDLWYRVNNPAQQYMQWHAQALEQLKAITSDILAEDKNALIVAVGDHGAYHWRGVSAGSDTPEKNVLKHGIQLDALAYDFFGVILGIHWGNVPVPALPAGLSHVNIFRYVFAALAGAQTPASTPAENISIYEGRYIIAKDGKPLTSYETLRNEKYSDYYALIIHSPELLDATFNVEQQLANNQLQNIEQNADKLYKIALATAPISLQHFNAAQALVKSGNVEKGTKLLDFSWCENCKVLGFEPYVYLVNAFIGIKDYDRAHKVVKQILSRPNYPHRQAYLFLMKILWRQQRFNEMLPVIPKLFNAQKYIVCDPIDQFALESTYSHFAIERLQGRQAALDWIKQMMAREAPNSPHYDILLVQKILLLLKHDKQRLMPLFQEILSQDVIPHGFALLYLQILIQSGQLDIAKDFLGCADCFKGLKTDIRFPIIADALYVKSSKDHFRAVMAKKEVINLIDKANLFDAAWYARGYHTKTEPLIDYIVNGIPLLRNPNPRFDIHFYLSAYPFVLMQGVDPLLHYILTNKTLAASPEQDKFFYNNVHPAFREKYLEEA